jgi:glutaconate CoA-transferase subunit A
VPYLPTKTRLGSDILARNTRVKVAPCPFTGQQLVLVPALTPDVAILVVQRSDGEGNAHCWGPTGVSAAAARASRNTILLAEEIVDADLIRSDPNRVVVPGFKVSAVVHAPWAGHPSPVQGCYNRDHESYAEYARRTRNRQDFLTWLNDWVLDVKDQHGYLAKLGTDRLEALRVKHSRLAAPVDYGC